MTLDEINALAPADFTECFGFLFEHSPWIAAGAAARRPFADVATMEAAFLDVVRDAGPDAELALLRAHPELAGKAAIDGTLTHASAAEQASAGLDRLTAEEFDRFYVLNHAYRERFGFPFVICVRLTNKAGILAALEARVASDRPTEMAIALGEVAKIVQLRLDDVLK